MFEMIKGSQINLIDAGTFQDCIIKILNLAFFLGRRLQYPAFSKMSDLYTLTVT